MSSLIIISETPHALKLSSFLSALLNHSQNEVVQTKVFSALKYKYKDMALTLWLTLMKEALLKVRITRALLIHPHGAFV